MSISDFCSVLKEVKTIAVVGISDKPYRDSGAIAELLQRKGFRVSGVHPSLKEVNDITVYPSLCDIPHTIDLVNVFLNRDKLPDIQQDIIAIKPKYVWLQWGVANESVINALEMEGIGVISNYCIAIELRKCEKINQHASSASYPDKNF